jgi:hypothetical protein
LDDNEDTHNKEEEKPYSVQLRDHAFGDVVGVKHTIELLGLK